LFESFLDRLCCSFDRFETTLRFFLTTASFLLILLFFFRQEERVLHHKFSDLFNHLAPLNEVLLMERKTLDFDEAFGDFVLADPHD